LVVEGVQPRVFLLVVEGVHPQSWECTLSTVKGVRSQWPRENLSAVEMCALSRPAGKNLPGCVNFQTSQDVGNQFKIPKNNE
jgi:hypothetical protein